MTLKVNESRIHYENGIYDEVEDIMCDQNIIAADFDLAGLRNHSPSIILSTTRLRIVVALLGRTLMPAVLKIYYVYLRNQQFIVENFKNFLLSSAVAFVVNSISSSLATVQKRIPFRATSAIVDQSAHLTLEAENDTGFEPSVDCEVLTCPETITTDAIFIHGLHGGVRKTWKQGQWRHEGHKLKHRKPVLTSDEDTNSYHVPPRTHYLKRTLSGIYSKPTKMAKRTRKDDKCQESDEEEWMVIDESEGDDRGGEDGAVYSQCWPQDWLPKDCPGVRVIALNYTTDLLWAPFWKKPRKRTGMVERSEEMIRELVNIGVGRHPITWVGHSKGGLYIKQILLNALEIHKDNPEIHSIFQQTKGIMFYSVPHRGSYLADVNLPRLLRQSVELLEVQRNCAFVLDQHRRFLELCNRKILNAEIFSFIETSFTLMSVVFLKIVAYESADPGIGVKCDVPLDHREICKPAGRDCFLYKELIKIIRKYMKDINGIVPQL